MKTEIQLQKKIIKTIKQCRKRLWEISTEIYSLDNDAYTYFSRILHKSIWKLQEEKIETDSEYDSDATVDMNMTIPEFPGIDSDEEQLSFDSSFENDEKENNNEIIENIVN